VDGFEPWWFIQEQLFWYLLAPYAQHRKLFHQKILAGEPVDIESAPSEVLNLCRRLAGELGIPSLRSLTNMPQSANWRRYVRHLITRISQVGLALVSVVSLVIFRLRRQDTLLYTIDKVSPGLDHDFRLSTIYRELRRRGYRFGEYVHIYEQPWQKLWRRHRPVVFFEMLSSIGIKLLQRLSVKSQPVVEIDFDPSDPDEVFLAAVAQWALRQSEASVHEVRILKWLLRLHGVRRAVMLDDSRHVNELVAACKSLGIPSLGCMHGMFTRYHTGLMAYSFGTARRHTFDLYGVWSEYFRQRLLAGDLYDESNTLVSGGLHLPADEALQAALSTWRYSPSQIRVLLVSEHLARQDDVLRYIEQLLDDERFQLMLKLRPGEEWPHLNKSADAQIGSLRIIHGGTVYEALSQSDVVLGTYSSVLYEAALALRPAVVLNTSFDFGHDIVRDGLAEFAKSPECVRDVVLRASALPREELIRRRNAIWGDRIIDGTSTLFDVAESRLWGESHD